MYVLWLACVAPECATRWRQVTEHVECFDRGVVVVCVDAYVCEEVDDEHR